MSSYPFWSFDFALPDDLDPALHRVLESLALDALPDPADLGTLHPVPRHYLGDWRRLLVGPGEPQVGSPVRLSGAPGASRSLSLSFSQHDDEFANVGWVFWLWVLRLAAAAGRSTVLLGHHHAFERHDPQFDLIVRDATGISEGGTTITYAELDAAWADVVADPYWATWASHP